MVTDSYPPSGSVVMMDVAQTCTSVPPSRGSLVSRVRDDSRSGICRCCKAVDDITSPLDHVLELILKSQSKHQGGKSFLGIAQEQLVALSP